MRTRSRAAALLTALAFAVPTVLVASPASAAPLPYSVQYLALGNGQKVVARWNPCRSHTYKVNLASVPAKNRAAVLAETHAAMRTLAAKTGMVKFTYKGATTEVPRVGSSAKQSADIIIAFTTAAKSNYLAGRADAMGGRTATVRTMTSGTTKTYTAAIVKGFVVVDSAKLMRKYKAGFGTGVRRGNLILHELGHVVGLNHVNNSRLLMNPMVSSVTPSGFAAGDAAGLAKIGRKAGCINGL